MKYISADFMDSLNNELMEIVTADSVICGRVEAYRCAITKGSGGSKKLYKSVLKSLQPNGGDGDLVDVNGISPKVLFYLISTLNSRFPAYEFSQVRPVHFQRHSFRDACRLLNGLFQSVKYSSLSSSYSPLSSKLSSTSSSAFVGSGGGSSSVRRGRSISDIGLSDSSSGFLFSYYSQPTLMDRLWVTLEHAVGPLTERTISISDVDASHDTILDDNYHLSSSTATIDHDNSYRDGAIVDAVVDLVDTPPRSSSSPAAVGGGSVSETEVDGHRLKYNRRKRVAQLQSSTVAEDSDSDTSAFPRKKARKSVTIADPPASGSANAGKSTSNTASAKYGRPHKERRGRKQSFNSFLREHPSIEDWERDVEVYTYEPDDATGAGDPLNDTDDTAPDSPILDAAGGVGAVSNGRLSTLWRHYYFFYNRKFKRMFFFTISAKSILVSAYADDPDSFPGGADGDGSVDDASDELAPVGDQPSSDLVPPGAIEVGCCGTKLEMVGSKVVARIGERQDRSSSRDQTRAQDYLRDTIQKQD